MNKTILQDKIFIKQLMEVRDRTTYVHITALDSKDEIFGYATEGSINIDGASAVRRSCNLTLVTDNLNINNYNWVLNTRFKLAIGIKNNTSRYPEEPIIWFPQGQYIITEFSAALGTSSYTISLSGQDKMCLMNGEISGLVTAETDFGTYELVDNEGKVIEKKALTLREIISSLVHTYGLEPFENIYIELPDESGYNLLTYRGKDPLYLLRATKDEEQVEDFTIYGDTVSEDDYNISLKTLGNYWQPTSINQEAGASKGDVFARGGEEYYVQKIEYGEAAGYEETPLTYAGELKAAAGEAVTNILDKIKNQLGDFEYFYDVDGVFRFQKKKTYLKTYINDSNALEAFTEGEYSYEFDDLSLFTSFNNKPDIKNLKNDFTVWGERKTASGASLPIHMRLAIQKKPTSYYSPWQDKTYSTTGEDAVDWRELIYQMAIDYQANHTNPNYTELLEATNPELVKDGRTGYEQYYTDLLGHWRYLYEPQPYLAIKGYKPTAANDKSITKYYHPWDIYENPRIDNKDYPYTSWYVDRIETNSDSGNTKYRVAWTDSIDLTPSLGPFYYYQRDTETNKIQFFDNPQPNEDNPCNLRQLYRYNASTDKFYRALEGKLREQSYNIYERNTINGSSKMIGAAQYLGTVDSIDALVKLNPNKGDFVYISAAFENYRAGDMLICETPKKEDTVVIWSVVNTNITNSLTWGIMDNLDNLYLKKPADPVTKARPLRYEIPLSQINSVSYTPGFSKSPLYIQRFDVDKRPISCTYLYYYNFDFNKSDDATNINLADKEFGAYYWSQVQAAFSDPRNMVFFRVFDKDSTKPIDIKYNPAAMSAYVVNRYKMNDDESKQYALYYKTGKGMRLYAQHLMDFGVSVSMPNEVLVQPYYQKIDMAWLSYIAQDRPKDLLDTLVINRKDLYRKVEDGQYTPAFELQKLIKENEIIYYRSKDYEPFPIDQEPAPRYESTKATDLSGNIEIGAVEEIHMIEYFEQMLSHDPETHWNKKVEDDPAALIFWFDLLDPDYYPQLARYSVDNVGARPKVKTEKRVTALYYPETPEIYFGKSCPLQDNMREYFVNSSQGQSAHDTIDSWLYNHTYVTESVTINSIPIYCLEPNTKIAINDSERGIQGDYIVSRLSIPLAYNGMMSITATKAPETF